MDWLSLFTQGFLRIKSTSSPILTEWKYFVQEPRIIKDSSGDWEGPRDFRQAVEKKA